MINEPYLIREDSAGITTLTFNRPKSLNSLSLGMLRAFRLELDRVEADESVRVVIIAGAGPVFCAGHDLKEIHIRNFGRDYTEELVSECAEVMLSIVRLPKPVIARVHGVATAAGCQLVATCDLAFAAEDARFATPGVNIGLCCSTPMVALSRNVSRKHAMQMLLSGELIDAKTASRIGLINEAVPASELVTRTEAFARQLAAKSPLALATGKEAFYRQTEMPSAAAYAHTSEAMIHNLGTLDAQEGVGAFVEKRAPVWQGR